MRILLCACKKKTYDFPGNTEKNQPNALAFSDNLLGMATFSLEKCFTQNI